MGIPITVRALLRVLPPELRRRAVCRRVRIDEGELAGLEAQVASRPGDVIQALRLLDRAYAARGIVTPAPTVRIPSHYEMDRAIAFVVRSGRDVVGTLSLVLDGPQGMPLDELYGDVLAPIRATGRRLAEVGALAVGDGFRRQGVSMLLYKLMFRTALEVCGVDDLIIAVHPHVADLYTAAMGFLRVGPVRRYPGMTRSALAVALRLDLRGARDNLARAFAGWPRDERNTFHMYFERAHPQIRLAADRAEMDECSRVRLQTVARLRHAPTDATTARAGSFALAGQGAD